MIWCNKKPSPVRTIPEFLLHHLCLLVEQPAPLLPASYLCQNSEHMFLGTTGKQLIRHMLNNPTTDPPLKIAQDLELLAFSPSISSAFSEGSTPTISDVVDPLIAFCEDAIRLLPSEVAAVKHGNKKVLNKIVGSVMKQSRGRADARRVREIVEELIYDHQP